MFKLSFLNAYVEGRLKYFYMRFLKFFVKINFVVTLRFRKTSSYPPLCIEDAERVGDPILFERPCKCIEDARSLVLRLDLAKCLAEEL